MKRCFYYFLRNQKINIYLIIYYSISLLQRYVFYCANIINTRKFGTMASEAIYNGHVRQMSVARWLKCLEIFLTF